MNVFLCKKNVLLIYKKLTQTKKLYNLTKEKKTSIINVLMGVMKRKYKTLEISKISQK